jgi:hypothetical protein
MALSPVQPRTFLQLVQDLYREVGASPGSLPSVAIPTTTGVTGEILRLTNYIHDADLEIQNMWVDWKFLRQTLTAYTIAATNTGIATLSGGSISAQPTDLAEWDYRTFFIFPAGSTSPQNLQVNEWQQVRGEVFDTTDQNQPWRVIVMPDNTLRWDLTPDASYQVQMEYRKTVYDLKVDADVSVIPARFANRLIVEWARLKYGMFEGASEQITAARFHIYGGMDDAGVWHTGLLAQLENDQLANAKNSRLQQGNNIVVGGGAGSDGSYGSDGYYGDRYW